MKYLANWQPLDNEDRHTALLFGFLRHAPTAYALDPWLKAVLGPSVTSRAIEQRSFWPRLPSVLPERVFTEPELVFEADDGEPVTIVVEVKPGYAMHDPEQIQRELVDVAAARNAARVCCIMVGADLSSPVDVDTWSEEASKFAAQMLPGEIDLKVRYASFETLGRVIAKCGLDHPEWSRYAEDVVAQLRRRGLMGYDGAPMLDDLEELTVPSAVEAFNRAIRAARELVLRLHTDKKFEALSLAPQAKEHRLLRNGNSVSPTASVSSFETTVAMSLYRRPKWDPAHVVFVCFDLRGSDPARAHADLCVGACRVDGEYTYGFPLAERVEALSYAPLERAASEHLTEKRHASAGDWRLARRPWIAGDPDGDLKWVVDRLRDACDLWEAVGSETKGLTHADFAGVSTETLLKWRRWWSDPKRVMSGVDEAGRDPRSEVEKLDAELRARGVPVPGQS